MLDWPYGLFKFMSLWILIIMIGDSFPWWGTHIDFKTLEAFCNKINCQNVLLSFDEKIPPVNISEISTWKSNLSENIDISHVCENVFNSRLFLICSVGTTSCDSITKKYRPV